MLLRYNDFCSKGELFSVLKYTPTTLLSQFSSSHYKQSLEGHSVYHIKCSFWHPNSVVFLVVGDGNNSMSQGIHFPTFNSHSLPLFLRETQRHQAKLGQSLGVQAMFPTHLTGRSGPSSLSEQCLHQSGQDRNQASHTHHPLLCSASLLHIHTKTTEPKIHQTPSWMHTMQQNKWDQRSCLASQPKVKTIGKHYRHETKGPKELSFQILQHEPRRSQRGTHEGSQISNWNINLKTF